MFCAVGLYYHSLSDQQTDAIHCAVVSADMTAWMKNEPMERSPGFYVEIKCCESSLKQTQVIKGKEAPSWNEEFGVYVWLAQCSVLVGV